MSTLPGYSIKKSIFEGRSSLVYRAARDADGAPVVIKMLRQEYPSPLQLARLRREFTMTRELAAPGVIVVHELCKYRSSLAIVLEDFGGSSLAEIWRRHPLELPEKLRVFAELARVLGRVHSRRVMHKDVNPANVVWNPDTGELKIIDFGISTELSRETPAILHPNVLEGTLAYMSPEQTGRMNRAMDYRTDLYSLGVTLYELLTDKLPFESRDPMELVHAHLARVPAPPHELEGSLGEASVGALSDVILKLLAKRAEDRYQSAAAVAADLERCRSDLRARGRIARFRVAERDISDVFQIPQKLYGRKAEVDELLAIFDEVGAGAKAMVLVAGHSGIGKSALVHEVHKPIVRQRGFFISGKFDQYNRNIPYASLIQAFQGLVQQLLTESAQRLEAWKERLGAALGPNGQVIIQVIPDVELIVGAQPAVPELAPAEAQNRFNLVFESFVRTFAAEGHPLAIFLDDLQWADAPSLRLVELLMTDAETKHMLLIGAYRDNEVDASHPLRFTVEEMRKAGARIHPIALGPLQLPDAAALVADTLDCDPELATPLARLCLRKTGGNPFFLNQFLLALYEGRHIDFDGEARRWRWDAARIASADMTDNVVELMAGKLQRLAPATLGALRIAACIGNTFDLATLGRASGKAPLDAAADLWPSLKEGLILPVGDAYKFLDADTEITLPMPSGRTSGVSYRFLHDRVQQAAYSLLGDAEKKALHLVIGRRLLESSSAEEREERLFTILGHLNLGADVLEGQAERDELAQWNLLGARKAKASAAHSAALESARAGLALLGAGGFERCHALALALTIEAAEASQLTTDFDGMERHAAAALARGPSLLDKVKIYEIRIAALIAQARLASAVAVAVEILELLGERFPAAPTDADVGAGLGEAMQDLAATGRAIEGLVELPEGTSPLHQAALRILANITSATYVGRPALFPLIVFRQVSLSARHGNTNASAYGYATYGIVLCGVVGDIDAGYRFGQMALRVSERFNAKEYEARTVYITCCFLRFWKEHLRETFRSFPGIYKAALESGDQEFAAWALMMRTMHGFFLGCELGEREREGVKYVRAMSQLKQATSLHYAEAVVQAIQNLRGASADPLRLVGEHYDEDAMLPIHREAGETFALANLHVIKLLLAYHLGDLEGALRVSIELDALLGAMASLYHVPVFFLYDSLARLARLTRPSRLTPEPSVTAEEWEAEVARAERQALALRGFAAHAPGNYLHKAQLVFAELARVRGDKGEARRLYRLAVAGAREHEYLQEEALGNELFARFWLAEEEPELARVYLIKARHLYEIWGAVAKVRHLEAHYPELLSGASAPAEGAGITSTTTTTGESSSSALDLMSVMKASQTITGEVVLAELLTKLIKIVIENAGAERGLLVLEQGGELRVEVECDEGGARMIARGSAPVEHDPRLSPAIVNYVARTRESVVLRDAANEGLFTADPYVARCRPKSLLCVPLVNQGKLIALLYLENNLTLGAFTAERLEVLRLLSAQAALSIHNAGLYASLEQKVEERTRELQEKNDELGATLEQLRATQEQLVNQEKLASLGALTAGIAHEIRNPLNFVNNFAELSVKLADELGEALRGDLRDPEVRAEAEEVLGMLRQNVAKIEEHGRRANGIVSGMVLHSRAGTSPREEADLNAVVAQSLTLALQGARALDPKVALAVSATYDPAAAALEIATADLTRVFLNIVDNACYATRQRLRASAAGYAPALEVSTRDFVDHVEVRFRDNGTGIPQDVVDKVFNPFFTTKPPGEGTGLGMSISHDIVVRGHQGEIRVESRPGEFTEFIVTLPRGPRSVIPRSRAPSARAR